MSVDTKNFDVADYLRVAPQCGLPQSNFAPQHFDDLCSAVAQRNVPPNAPPGFIKLTTACLIARGMIYWKSVPGDCGSATRVDLENANLAQGTGNIAIGIASMAGHSLPGLGEAVSAIAEIFAHHAQAVANEQATICRVLGVMNQVFGHYDRLVRSGQISPSTAYRGLQDYIGQVTGQLNSILKSCNSACVWIGVLSAHADFLETYYPSIAPVGFFAHAPGAAPANDYTVPGGVVQVGGAGITLPFVGSFRFSGGEVFFGFAAIVVILVILFTRGGGA